MAPANQRKTRLMTDPQAHDSRIPYLSVVVTTRNDDHGGDPLKRLQAFINTLAAQCRRTRSLAQLRAP